MLKSFYRETKTKYRSQKVQQFLLDKSDQIKIAARPKKICMFPIDRPTLKNCMPKKK
jgi:hypothetical protein